MKSSIVRIVVLLEPRRDAPAIHARTGYMPGEFGLYERMHVWGYLEAFAAFRDTRADRSAHRSAAPGPRGRPIHELSHGNEQKVGLVQALMAPDPDLVVLDEPTQGLDPLVAGATLRADRRDEGHGGPVFLSSHILPEVEACGPASG